MFVADKYPWSKQRRVSFHETASEGIDRKGERKRQRRERIKRNAKNKQRGG
jgi:hypothetical protein